MKLILFAFVLLSVGLHSYSKDVNLADVDYCIGRTRKNIKRYREGNIYGVMLVLVKKNNDLKYTYEPIECISSIPYRLRHSYIHSSDFYFINESGQKIFYFDWIGGIDGGIVWITDGPCEWRSDCSEAEYLDARTWILPKIEFNFPPASYRIKTTLKKFRRDDLLQLKNKIINATMNVRVKCESDFDTTYRIDFRARITGECDCDSTEDKKDTQKNKLKKTNGNGNRSIEK